MLIFQGEKFVLTFDFLFHHIYNSYVIKYQHFITYVKFNE